MVTMTSEASAASQVRWAGVWSVRSMPTSRMASTTAGLRASAGAEPAERTSTVSPARWRSQPAAIWERPALWTQTNRTVGLAISGILLGGPVQGQSSGTAGERRFGVLLVVRDGDPAGGPAGIGVKGEQQAGPRGHAGE